LSKADTLLGKADTLLSKADTLLSKAFAERINNQCYIHIANTFIV
jgi:hypothetical protein